MKILQVVGFTASLVFTATAFADGGFTPDEAFQTLLKLEGTWPGEAVVVPAGQSREDATPTSTTVSFKTIGNSSVMQTFAEGTPAEMVSLYHQNGKEELIHTHYCAIGNQPSMAFRQSDEAGAIDFRFTEARKHLRRRGSFDCLGVHPVGQVLE